MRSAVEGLATVVPDWIAQIADPSWYERYAKPMFSFRAPKADKAREELAKTIGADGYNLLEKIDNAQGMQWLREVPSVVTLRKVWEQQYTKPPEPPRFLDIKEQPPCAERIVSPHDDEARFSKKQDLEWIGYKVHLTETCDEGKPRIIMNVQTRPATEPDWNMLPEIHESLKQRDNLPSTHLVDTGYVCTDSLISSQRDYQVQVIGPPVEDKSWQAQEGGFDKSYFALDWQKQQATCPGGKVSKHWTQAKDGKIEISFDPYDCYRCPYREVCVRGTTAAGHPKVRHLNLQPQEKHEALQSARQNLKDKEFWKIYKERAGIEGTISQAVRNCNVRRARYIGFKKVSLQQTISAISINFTRLGSWLLGTPLAKTRNSKLLSLRAA